MLAIQRYRSVSAFLALLFWLALPSPADDGSFKFFGIVQTVGVSGGNWQIGGRVVRVAPSARVDAGIAAGACVEVEGALQTDASVLASAIRADSASKCAGAPGQSPLKFVGSIQQLPAAGLAGDWIVSAKVVHVTAATRVRQDKGPMARGACVEVQGAVNPDTSIAATEIDISSGSGGCGDPAAPEGAELKFYAPIQTMPQGGAAGDWLVGGRLVHVLSAADVRAKDKPLAVGICVDVEARVQPDGTANATRLEGESSSCAAGTRNTPAPKFVGAVQSFPAGGGTGDWRVGNRVVRVSSSTEIERERGPVAVAACVEVRGQLQADNSVVASKIEVQDASYCGADARFEHIGTIDASPAGNGVGDWRIGGRTVRVTAATVLNTEHGTRMPGACVEVQGTLQPDGSIAASRLEVVSSSGTCLLRGGVVNAASFSSLAVSPGLIVSVFGLNIGPSSDRAAEVLDDRLSSRVANTRVLFDGIPAPVVFTSAGQMNVIVPYSLAGRSSTQVQVENNGSWSNPVTLAVVPSAPAIFTLGQSGKGPGAILNYEQESQRFTVNGSANAAPRGSYVSIYATGEGQTEPRGDDGRINRTTLPRPALPLQVSIGGKRVDDANIQYYGAIPGFASGALQVNVRIPDDSPVGAAVPIVLTIGGRGSRDDVTMSIR